MKIFLSLLAALAMPTYAQSISWFAPDLGWTTDRSSYLGLTNPGTTALTATVSGFTADGTPLGSLELTLAAHGRWETAANALFDGAAVAWARIESDSLLAGYVRYQAPTGNMLSIAPLAAVAGREAWLPQINGPGSAKRALGKKGKPNSLKGEREIGSVPVIKLPGEIVPRTVLVNVSQNQGSAQLAPVYKQGEQLLKTQESQTVAAFGQAYQQTELVYSDSFTETENLVWDRVSSEDGLQLSAIQHLVTDNQTAAASFNLTRTPYHEMTVGPMQPNQDDIWNKLVLINTYSAKLPIRITANYNYYGNEQLNQQGSVSIDLDLEPLEQRVFDIQDSAQLNLPANAGWYRITSFGGGLIGYQVFGKKDGSALGAIEAGTVPTGTAILPYTPSDETLKTDVSLINPHHATVRVFLAAYNDEGDRLAVLNYLALKPGDKLTQDTETLFGEVASQVTWIEAFSSVAPINAYSVVSRRDGGSFAGMQGVAVKSGPGDLFQADFDHFNTSTLNSQEWTPYYFTDAGSNNRGRLANYRARNGDGVVPGDFFIEAAFGGADGFFFLGYDPYNTDFYVAESNGTMEQVALVSPYLEIPNFGDWYLSFSQRIFNPDLTTERSKYGLVWREEASDEWHWFGIGGYNLQHPDAYVADCLGPISYRNEIVMITQWLPFEMKLPASTRGKRIQLGYFFEYTPDGMDDKAPWSFVDRIRISSKKLLFSLFYPRNGEGSFTVDSP